MMGFERLLTGHGAVPQHKRLPEGMINGNR